MTTLMCSKIICSSFKVGGERYDNQNYVLPNLGRGLHG